MARDDPQVNVRLPVGMREKITALAKENNRSANAEIVARLQGSFDMPANGVELDQYTRKDIEEVARDRNISFEEAMHIVLRAGLDRNAPGVLYVRLSGNMTSKQMMEAIRESAQFLPENSRFVLGEDIGNHPPPIAKKMAA